MNKHTDDHNENTLLIMSGGGYFMSPWLNQFFSRILEIEIAKKMKQISSSCQVLAITHLPQVAASADNQLLIYKEELDGRTFANVKLMSKEERILQIARMISGKKISTYAISQAEDLLNN